MKSSPADAATNARRARLFRAFCVGIPKTGTTSIGTIFGNYRSTKIAGSALEDLGCDLRDGKTTEDLARAFIRNRDAEAWLEMDPASANWMVVGLLTEEFPSAKFIVTIRDCYSWCDSMINVVVGREIGLDFLDHPARFRRLIGADLDWFRDVESVIANADAVFESLLRFWSRQMHPISKCPAERRLIVRTDEISSSLGKMADFVGVPPKMLMPEHSHSRRTMNKLDVLRRLDRDWLLAQFAGYADCDLMAEHFPNASLDAFLGPRAARPEPSATATMTSVASAADVYPVGYWLSQAEAHASRGDVVAATNALEEATKQTLEADEAQRAREVRLKLHPLTVLHTPIKIEEAPDYREIRAALAVVGALAARGVPQRFGYRLQKQEIETKEGRCLLLVVFARAGRVFALEIGVSAQGRSHWLASSRFAISYRRATPPIGDADTRLSQLLLDTIERAVALGEA